MADNQQDRNSRRPLGRSPGGGQSIRPLSLTASDTIAMTGTISAGHVGSPATESGFPVEMALAEASGPWKKDRITLSLEAQVIMMEMKAAAKDLLDLAGQIYSNVVSQIKIAAGRFVMLESFGGYRLRWKN